MGHLDELAGPPEPNPAVPGRHGTRGSGRCGLETRVHETKLERRKIRAPGRRGRASRGRWTWLEMLSPGQGPAEVGRAPLGGRQVWAGCCVTGVG